jgi:hypothetical protein
VPLDIAIDGRSTTREESHGEHVASRSWESVLCNLAIASSVPAIKALRASA